MPSPAAYPETIHRITSNEVRGGYEHVFSKIDYSLRSKINGQFYRSDFYVIELMDYFIKLHERNYNMDFALDEEVGPFP
jgi:hypothetical protein